MNPVLAESPKESLYSFIALLLEEDSKSRIASVIYRAALQDIRYYHNHKTARLSSVSSKMETHWYKSLESGEPDYGIYSDPMYLANLWACWIVYSRKYLGYITQPSRFPPDGLVASIENVQRVVDLGCGIGYTTAALSFMFPKAKVWGTNVEGAIQTRIARRMGEQCGFTIQHVPVSDEPVDIAFASEYFEHFLEPIKHLREVVEGLHPRYMILANAFGSRSIGHFNKYLIGDSYIINKGMNGLFSEELVALGYEQVETKIWNSRPSVWRRT